MELLSTTEQTLNRVPLPPTTNRRVGTKATTQADGPHLFNAETLALRIELGRTCIRRDEIVDMRTGSVVPLDGAAGDLVDLYAGQRLIARGELLAIEGVFGVRVTELAKDRCH